MSEQTGGNDNDVVTGDDGVVVSAGEEADIADVRNGGKKRRIPVPRWVRQYAHHLGIPLGKAQERLIKDGFQAKNIGL